MAATTTCNDDMKTSLSVQDEAPKSTARSTRVPSIDHGWAWVVLAASFLTNMLVDGVCYSFGLYYLEFLDYFGSSKSQTSWAGSILNGMYLGMGPVASLLAGRVGNRTVAMVGAVLAAVGFFSSSFSPNIYVLILTYGAIAGFGFGLMYLPAIVMVGLYFDKRRAFATGLAMCGSGIGIFAMAPFWEYLISVYSWKGALWITASVVLNGLVCGAIYRPLPTFPETQRTIPEVLSAKTEERLHVDQQYCEKKQDQQELEDLVQESNCQKNSVTTTNCEVQNNREEWTNGKPNAAGARSFKERLWVVFKPQIELIKNPAFELFAWTHIFGAAGFFVPVAYLPDFAKSHGVTTGGAALLMSILGISNMLARLVCGFLADFPWANPLILHNVWFIISGVSTILLPFCTVYWLMALYAAVYGASVGFGVTINPILIVDLLGVKRLADTFGLLSFFHGIGVVLGPPVAGYLFDWWGNYGPAFYMTGVMFILVGVLCLPLRRVATWYQSKYENSVVLEVSVV